MLTTETLQRILEGKHLSESEAVLAMDSMMQGNSTPAQMGSFLTALRIKGETVEELVGFAKSMRSHGITLPSVDDSAIDTCGTGGDGGKTFNISTAASFVVAAGGVPVAKHGNRAVSSRSGSADVLEKLGITIQQTPIEAGSFLQRHGLCFLFAPLFHQSMRHVMQTRKELGFRTCFNLLGPLANPAQVKRQLIGVYDPRLTEMIAQVCKQLGIERALVVSSLDGLDEITVTGETQVSELRDGEIITYQWSPEQFGYARSRISEIAGGTAEQNANLMRRIFQGKVSNAASQIVCLNAGAAFYLAGRVDRMEHGVELAETILAEGTAFRKLEEMMVESMKGEFHVFK